MLQFNNKMDRAVFLFPILTGGALYGLSIARIFTQSALVLWFGAFALALMFVYIVAMFLRVFVSKHTRRTSMAGIVFGFSIIVGFLALGRYVMAHQDRRFLRRLPEYQEVVSWVLQSSVRVPPPHVYAGLADQVTVRTASQAGTNVVCVFFVAYSGPFGTRLRGYAFNSADSWNTNFTASYGQPKRLTNHWFRI